MTLGPVVPASPVCARSHFPAGAAELWGRRDARGRSKVGVGLCGLCSLPFFGRTLSVGSGPAGRAADGPPVVLFAIVLFVPGAGGPTGR